MVSLAKQAESQNPGTPILADMITESRVRGRENKILPTNTPGRPIAGPAQQAILAGGRMGTSQSTGSRATGVQSGSVTTTAPATSSTAKGRRTVYTTQPQIPATGVRVGRNVSNPKTLGFKTVGFKTGSLALEAREKTGFLGSGGSPGLIPGRPMTQIQPARPSTPRMPVVAPVPVARPMQSLAAQAAQGARGPGAAPRA